MKHLITILFFCTGTLTSGPAFAKVICKWTAQDKAHHYTEHIVYGAKPKVEKQACGGSSAAPLCSGYVYCADENPLKITAPPPVIVAGCKAIKVNGKWRCPDADTCASDDDVSVARLARIPKTVQAAAPGQGSGGALREKGQAQ